MRLRAALAAAIALGPLGAAAQETLSGRNLAASCAICHGTGGRSATSEVASLAGTPREQFIAQMKAFREGTRPATVMHQIAKGYSETQVERMADYFAAQGK